MKQVPPNYGSMVQGGCVLVFGMVFALFSLIFLSVAFVIGAPWYFKLFSLPFLAAGLGMVGFGAWNMAVRPGLVARSFGPAQASVSPQTLPVGQPIEIRYERPARRNVTVSRVAIRLISRETAQYRRGTDTHTAIHDNIVESYESPGRRLSAGESITERCTLTVPRDSMHTFSATRNKLSWLVQVAIQIPASPDAIDELAIVVVPDVHSEASRGSAV